MSRRGIASRAMAFVPDLAYYSRIARGVRELLTTPAPGNWGGLIREQLENREERFLDTVRRAVFDVACHPYRTMFELAGCGFGDLAASVRKDGLETALSALRRAGVYLTHDEFKGRQPIVRSGRLIPGGPGSFRNPLVHGWLETSSGGSRSNGTATRRSTPHRIHMQAYYALNIREFGLDRRCQIQVKPILPAGDGIGGCLAYEGLGCHVDRWFAPAPGGADSIHYRLATSYIVAVARLHGKRVPFPRYLPPNDFTPAAEWIARRHSEGVPCTIGAHASPAVRIATAAAAKGLDIRGALFFTGGEALTEAKRAVIEATGASVFPRYNISEIGAIGYACRRMTSGNSVHLFHDSVAVVPCRRRLPVAEVEVNSLLFTTLLPSAPFNLINVEMEDCGELDEAPCDCVFGAAGFRRRIHRIGSFGKLTGQGCTLAGSDAVHVLEAALPARFGGAPGDYQLVEREGARQTELILRVSPRVRLRDVNEVRACFLREIRKFQGGVGASRAWRNAEALEVVSAEPFATRAGKVNPLHLMGAGGSAPHES